MKPIRFYIAMISARFVYLGLRVLRRNGTHLPGVVAVKIYPDILKYLEVSDQFVAITGTNGKTSTTNMVLSFLESQKVSLVANQAGSNIQGGVISALLTSTTFFGKNKVDVAVLEIDERASLYIFPYIQPSVLAVTNLFRDSYTRNAHVDYILDTLNTSIPNQTKLILNSDDVLAASLKPENERQYFSILPQEGEQEVRDSIIQDTPYCPMCGAPLTYDFQRYHHIGKVHCNACGFKNPTSDFKVIEIHDTGFVIQEGQSTFLYLHTGDNLTDIYNKLCAIAVLRQMGYEHEVIQDHFNHLKTVESRFNETVVNQKRFVTMLAKDQNPVANSRSFDYLRQQTQWGRTIIVIMNEAHGYSGPVQFAENTAWIYDANFEYLNQEHIQKIYCVGSRAEDYKVRLLLGGIDASKISASDTKPEIDEDFDTVVLLHSTKNIQDTFKFKDTLMKKEMNHEN